MLSELVNHVVGVDPDRDRVTAAVVDAKTAGEVERTEFPASPSGYAALIAWADGLSEPDARVWSLEGAGSYGAGLHATLASEGEWVVEFDRPQSRTTKDGAKSDGLDAVRAARELLGRTKFSQPRARGTREAIRVLLVTRDGAQRARVAAINGLKALVVTAPVTLREELRQLTTTSLVRTCRRLRLAGGVSDEVAGTKRAMRALARRIGALEEEIAELEDEMGDLVKAVAPALLEEFGVGVVSAAQFIASWSHQGRCRDEAAFARLAGVAPIEANSGQSQDRHRLSRGGDRKLNRALHTVVLTRARSHPETRSYVNRRVAEGKTPREARRCLKRYLARHLFRVLERSAL